MSRVIVYGGYGVFGADVARALSAWGTPLTIAGRNLREAQAFARQLGGNCQAAAADVTRPDLCRATLEGHHVAVNCAGPFHHLDTTLLEACLQSGCHYADIADDRAYTARVRSFDERFAARGLAAVHGCSSLPGISGALALLNRDVSLARIDRVRVTLFIGNKNPKGPAAVRSLLAGLGRPIAAPQGVRFGFRDREVVPLPAPFGRRGVFNFEAPEYDLFPPLLDARAVAVKVGCELRLVTYGFALLAAMGSGYGPLLARLLELPGRMLGWLGCSGGAVMTELFRADGSVQRAALVASHDGQRMAALPCALAARALAGGAVSKRGTVPMYEFFGARPLLEQLVEAGFALHTEPWLQEGNMEPRLIYLGGNGHCAARLTPARVALARLTSQGPMASFDLIDVPYPGFEDRPRARDFETFLASVSASIAAAAAPGGNIILYGTGIGGLLGLCLRARGEWLELPLLLQAPVLWSLERRLMPRLMRLGLARLVLQRVFALAWFQRRFFRKQFERPVAPDLQQAFFAGYARCPAAADCFAWFTPALLRQLERQLTARPESLKSIGVWWGARDRVVSLQELAWTEQALGVRWPVRTFPDWGHYPMIDEPEEWVEALSNVLATPEAIPGPVGPEAP